MVKRFIKGIYRRFCKLIFGVITSVKTKREKILLIDNIAEKNAVPIDNFTLFKYLYDKNECKYAPFYIVNYENDAALEMKNEFGNRIIIYKHRHDIIFLTKIFVLLLHTRFVCESFQALEYINSGISEAIKKSNNITSIFTQHGITFFKDDFIRPNVYGHKIFDKVMVSNEFEKEIYVKRGNYKEEDIIRNGLFRWDEVQKKSVKSKDIFLFFTYRRYLFDLQNIKESVYFKRIQELLANKLLRELLVKNQAKLKIAMHHTLVDKLGYELFKGISIIKEDDIENAKETAGLLITDYSSMCFEFMIQNKPVIFYKIGDMEDCEKYGYLGDRANPYHEKEKYLNNIFDNTDDIIEAIKKYIESDYSLEEKDIAVNNYFYYYNNSFCERFYTYLSDEN